MAKEERKRQKIPDSIVGALWRAFRSLSASMPVFLGVILLMGLLRTFLSKEVISSVFTGSMMRDTLIGTVLGSVSAGNPITSYIIGGELLKRGVSLFAVTAFIVAWVTVGVVQYPAEASLLGKRFATVRNVLSFLLAVGISLATVTILAILR